MGITGLLPMLKKASTNCNVRRFSGCTAAIDTYGWLHKGAFGCAVQLGKGEPTTAYITYCVKYINILLSHNIKPIMVFDGRNLPSKSVTEKKRREKREENRKNAKEFLRKGMNKEAWECFTRCVDITPAMAREFIKVLRGMKIDYIVAPYEADAQIAYLARNNFVDVVITEDSDLVLFGCPKIFFKMGVTGDGVLFDQTKIPNCLGIKPEQFDFDRFRWMCILSGCDYLPSIPGIGLGRAKKLIEGTTSNDIRKILKSIPKVLRNDVEVPEEYIQGFIQAEQTFLYQLVFDTVSLSLVPLTPYAVDIKPTDLGFAGDYVDAKLALNLALGNADLHTLRIVDNFNPTHPQMSWSLTSIWSQNYTIPTEIKVVTARDTKSKAENASTAVGMQANVSIGFDSKRKRDIRRDETKSERSSTSEADDEELLSMYSNKKSVGDSPELLDYVHKINLSLEKLKSSKRKRGSLSQSSTEKEEVDHDENEEQQPKRRSARHNPFLITQKTPPVANGSQKCLTNNTSPICLIERNKIYKDDENIKVVVKSQYFRHLENEAGKLLTIFVGESCNTKSEIKHEFVDEADHIYSESAENASQDSQVSIYTFESNVQISESQTSSDIASDELNSGNAATLITIQDDDSDSESFSVRNRLRNSFLKSSPRKRISPKKAKLGPCKKVGMSKSALKPKFDSKQKTISSMFALKPKPKL